MAAIVNITVTNDADFYRVFQYVTTNPDGSIGPPIDMTGSSLEMMLRRRAEDVTALLRLGTDTGEIVFLDIVNGLFSVRIPQDTLEQLGLGDFDHSNIMTNGGYKTRIWSGVLTNNAGPTR
jgi:hypothetical protein